MLRGLVFFLWVQRGTSQECGADGACDGHERWYDFLSSDYFVRTTQLTTFCSFFFDQPYMERRGGMVCVKRSTCTKQVLSDRHCLLNSVDVIISSSSILQAQYLKFFITVPSLSKSVAINYILLPATEVHRT